MQQGDVLAERYVIERLLGRGGMGQVFRARDRVLGRLVALKVLSSDAVGEDDEESVARVLTEARLAAQVRHPNVVQVLDALVSEDHHPVIVLEHVDGPTLAEVVRRRAPLPVEEALDVVHDVAAGLDAVHRAALVHRDVSPANILLDHGTARLTDFGIARSMTAADTLTGTIRGSVAYVAPEQATGGQVGAATDVYALACVAVTMLTGRPPFTADEPLGVVHQHVSAVPPDTRSIRPEVDPAVAVALRAALVKDPDRRIPTPAALAAAIGRPLDRDDTSVTVVPSPPIERTGGDRRTRGEGDDAPAGSAPLVLVDTTGDAGVGDVPASRVSRRRRWSTLLLGAAVAATAGAAFGVSMGTPDGLLGASETTIDGPAVPAAPTVDGLPIDDVEDSLLELRRTLVDLQSGDAVRLEHGVAIDRRITRALDTLAAKDLDGVSAQLDGLRDSIRVGVDEGGVTTTAEVALLESIVAVELMLDTHA